MASSGGPGREMSSREATLGGRSREATLGGRRGESSPPDTSGDGGDGGDDGGDGGGPFCRDGGNI